MSCISYYIGVLYFYLLNLTTLISQGDHLRTPLDKQKKGDSPMHNRLHLLLPHSEGA